MSLQLHVCMLLLGIGMQPGRTPAGGGEAA